MGFMLILGPKVTGNRVVVVGHDWRVVEDGNQGKHEENEKVGHFGIGEKSADDSSSNYGETVIGMDDILVVCDTRTIRDSIVCIGLIHHGIKSEIIVIYGDTFLGRPKPQFNSLPIKLSISLKHPSMASHLTHL